MMGLDPIFDKRKKQEKSKKKDCKDIFPKYSW